MSEPTYRVEPAEVSVKGWAVKHEDGRVAVMWARLKYFGEFAYQPREATYRASQAQEQG